MVSMGSEPRVQIPAWGIDFVDLSGRFRSSKPAAPLQECVLRRVFFCPDALLQSGERGGVL